MSTSPAQSFDPVIVDVFGPTGPCVMNPAHPTIFWDDAAASRGDGVFETLMVRGGVVVKQERHEQRFVDSAALLDLPRPDIALWREAAEMAVARYREQVSPSGVGAGEEADGSGAGKEAAMRWVYSRGRESTGAATGWITVSPIAPSILHARERGVAVMTAQRGFRIDVSQHSPWALLGAKTLSYAANMAALREAKRRGFEDVIFLDEQGRVLEGPTSSVVVLRDGELLTPPRDLGILPGTTQAALFARAECVGLPTAAQVLSADDLAAADAVWLVSSVRIKARVTAIDGRPIRAAESAQRVIDQVESLLQLVAERGE